MQCSSCNGQEFENISYNYYECKTCGKLFYRDMDKKKRSGAVNEIYLAIGAVAVIVIIAVFILLFVTAAAKRSKLLQQVQQESNIIHQKEE